MRANPELRAYIARALAGLSRQLGRPASMRELSRALGRSESIGAHISTARQMPSETTMIAIADLAEVPRALALLDLCRWRCPAPAVMYEFEALKKLLLESTNAQPVTPLKRTRKKKMKASDDAGAPSSPGQYLSKLRGSLV